jgi:hypothetical protein
MSRVLSFLTQTRLTTSDSSTYLPELDQSLALKETLEGLDALLNDDVDSIFQLACF